MFEVTKINKNYPSMEQILYLIYGRSQLIIKTNKNNWYRKHITGGMRLWKELNVKAFSMHEWGDGSTIAETVDTYYTNITGDIEIKGAIEVWHREHG